MNTYLNAAVGAERQRELIAHAAEFRRTRVDPKVSVRRPARSRRVAAFLKDLTAASL